MNFSPTCRQKPECQCSTTIYCQHNSGLLIFRGKKSKISRDFQGQIRGKIGRFRGIFAGKTSRNSQKNRPISLGFSGKKSNFEGFSGANSWKNRPISRDFRGENKSKFAKKQADFAGVQRQKVKFRRIFRGKFAEKSAGFAGFSRGKQVEIRRKIG